MTTESKTEALDERINVRLADAWPERLCAMQGALGLSSRSEVVRHALATLWRELLRDGMVAAGSPSRSEAPHGE